MSDKIKVCIVGAGLAGTMAASLLAEFGFEIHIFERRDDPTTSSSSHSPSLSETKPNDENDADSKASVFGNSTNASKRSINLALSHRGQCALSQIGLLNEVMTTAIPMTGRMIHDSTGTLNYQPYGKKHEAINSISRETLNILLLNRCKSLKNVHVHFGYTIDVLLESDILCKFKNVSKMKENSTRGEFEMHFDFIIGADGAYSSTRELMLKKGRINFSRSYIAHGYKELHIPPSKDGNFQLENPNALHIWPRGEFMLIALPNADKSFTATLFAPYSGQYGFDSIDQNDPNMVMQYFQKYFPDAIPLLPDLVNDFKNNPVGALVTVKVKPWHVKLGNDVSCVLIGDAAHAVVPFYGQGMNAAFEDGLMLYQELVGKSMGNPTAGSNISLTKGSRESWRKFLSDAAASFSQKRQPSADGLAHLCIEHYDDMASSTLSTVYHIKNKIESVVSAIVPSWFVPLYSMVTFSRTPYHEVS